MNPADEADLDDPRVLEAARSYLAQLEAGQVPDRGEFLARHPDLESALNECFDGIDLAHAAGEAMRPASMVESPTEPLGDFKIIREIGRGGMGVVYEAMQLSLGRRVALKVLPFAAALDAKHLQRFKIEAQAAAQLHHTNIVPVHAVGNHRGVHYYAMQLIDGQPIDTLIRDQRGPKADASTINLRERETSAATGRTARGGRGREAFRTVARIVAQAANALEYAHNAGVIHRDIKPANLLLDGQGAVWITDFGLAQVTADISLTQTGDVFGTLRYMSPEQASGRTSLVDHRTDVYSLGATLYELLTLEPIFPGHDRPTLLNQILNEDPRPPRQFDRSIPIELETIVMKAVAKLPVERYASAGDFEADLRRFLDERPILARRPTLIDRGKKWMRRHPSFVAAGVLLLVAGVIGLAISTAMIAQAQQRTRDALKREQNRAAEAEARFQLARRSADELIRIADQELADNPAQQTLRRLLLETALAYYQEFIDLRRDDATAQAELEVTRNRVQSILADLAVLQRAWHHMLLGDPSVQNDLALTPDQRNGVVNLMRSISERRQEAAREAYRLTAEQRSQQFVDEVKTHDAMATQILNEAQRRRLGQIALQMRGPMAFREPDVIAALGLTPEQRARIRELEGTQYFIRADGYKPGPGFAPGPGPGHRRGPDLDPRAATERILATLTAEQNTKWKELTGEPFAGLQFGMPRGPGPFGPNR